MSSDLSVAIVKCPAMRDGLTWSICSRTAMVAAQPLAFDLWACVRATVAIAVQSQMVLT